MDHTFYNTDSVLHTMELLLGLPPMSQYDAVATPILDFDTAPNNGAVFTPQMPSSFVTRRPASRTSAARCTSSPC